MEANIRPESGFQHKHMPAVPFLPEYKYGNFAIRGLAIRHRQRCIFSLARISSLNSSRLAGKCRTKSPWHHPRNRPSSFRGYVFSNDYSLSRGKMNNFSVPGIDPIMTIRRKKKILPVNINNRSQGRQSSHSPSSLPLISLHISKAADIGNCRNGNPKSRAGNINDRPASCQRPTDRARKNSGCPPQGQAGSRRLKSAGNQRLSKSCGRKGKALI